jgi:hypothetical protein
MEQERPQETFKQWVETAANDNLYFMKDRINDGVMSDRNWNKKMTQKFLDEEHKPIHPTDPCTRLLNTRKRYMLKLQLKKLEQLEQKNLNRF